MVTISAADPDGLQANQGFNVSVGSDQGDPATVVVFDLKSVEDNSAVDPTNVSGDVWVVLDVQNNDETVAGIALTLGDAVIQCRGSSASADHAAPGLAASGSTEYNCLFKSAATMGECMGEQLAPMYANGEYEIGAFLTTSEGERRDAAAALPVTLKNASYVDVVHHAGRAVTHGGRTFHGGPGGEGNMNSFSACPVSFMGTEVGSLTLEAKRTDTDSEPRQMVEGPTVSFQTGKEEPDNDPSPTLTEAPYTWTIDPEFNAMVETMDGDEFWVVNSGAIMNADGGDVTAEFRKAGEAMNGPLHFDFKAPTLAEDAEIQVAEQAIVAGTSYSGGKIMKKDSDFSLMGGIDGGVGINNAMTMIAVGDCAKNETDVDKVDRTKVGFMAIEGYEDVSGIADLEEEDAGRSKTDKNGADCYVAELAMLADQLGNAWKGGETPASWLQTANFGVDKTAPKISNVEHDDGDVFGGDAVIEFEVENPKLASGDNGTAISGMLTRPGATASADPIPFGKVAAVGGGDDDDWQATVTGLPKDGEYDVTVTVQDGAMPPNKDSFEANLVYDATSPTFTAAEYLSDVAGGLTATIDLGGSLKDKTSGIEEYKLSVFRNTGNAVAFCGEAAATGEPADTAVAATRLPKDFSKARKGKGSTSINIPAFALKPPATTTEDGENLCVEVSAEDRAGNKLAATDAAFVTVNWRSNIPQILITGLPAGATADTIAEGAVLPDDLQIALGATPTGEVTIEFESSDKDVLPAPADLTLAADAATTAVSIATGGTSRTAPEASNDDDASDDKVTITATAKGGGYDGMTASFDVVVTDNDWLVTVSDTEIEQGASDTVTVTLTRAASAKGSATTGATTGVNLYASANHASITVPATTSLNFANNKTTATAKIRIVVSSATPTGSVITLRVDDDADATNTHSISGVGDLLPSAGAIIVITAPSGG
ncbi:hypothetical protein [Candidatus Palauibacter sp.]|uniref:hypothetical protein n=1 Tax=Candidatus Palauibacter sp. TaxID=3101350 RepID=UPI003D0E5F80